MRQRSSLAALFLLLLILLHSLTLLHRLPKRENLVEVGYLSGPRESVLEEFDTIEKIQQRLKELRGEDAVEIVGDSSGNDKVEMEAGGDGVINSLSLSKKRKVDDEGGDSDNGEDDGNKKKKRKKEKKEKKEKKKKKSNLFKEGVVADEEKVGRDDAEITGPKEGSDEYWNEQRAKLGLKPLKK